MTRVENVERYEAFKELNKVELSPGPHNIGYLCDGFDESRDLPPANFDHPDLWLKDGKPYMFTSQPYRITKDFLEIARNICVEHDLEMTIDAREAWYMPGRTVLVAFRKKEV